MGKKKNPRIYSYDDIVEYELLEDGDTITKGGLGRALVGGAVFGGTGAIVGGVTGGKRSKKVINSLKIKITIDDFESPVVYIHLITSKSKANSFVYKTNFALAQEILSTFALIQKQREKTISTVLQRIREIRLPHRLTKYLNIEELMDHGIITQEEFEAKKKQLLGL